MQATAVKWTEHTLKHRSKNSNTCGDMGYIFPLFLYFGVPHVCTDSGYAYVSVAIYHGQE